MTARRLAGEGWRRFAVAVLLAQAALFLYTGFVKLRSPEEFAAILSAHGLVPYTLTLPAAVIGVELTAAAAALLWLMAGRTPARAAMVLAALFALFGVYALLLTLRPPPVPTPCGCGVLASSNVEDWTWIAARNLAFAVFTAFLGLPLRGRPALAPA